MKATKQLSCTYIDHSSDIFLQVKNILTYNYKPNIIQRNFIDCMELRSAEIRSHIVIRRTSRVYPLCVFRLLQHRHTGRDRIAYTSSPPSSFTVAPPPCTKSSLITCCIRILITCCIRILVTCCIRILVTCFIRILVTCCIRILVTCLLKSSLYVIFESIVNHIHKNPS